MSYYPGRADAPRHTAAFVLFFVGIALTIALYYVKTRAQTAKAEAVRLERLVKTERAALDVLKAEMAYLESPARVSVLAKDELGLVPITADKTIQLSEVAIKFPLREQVATARQAAE